MWFVGCEKMVYFYRIACVNALCSTLGSGGYRGVECGFLVKFQHLE
jgi:hypothetical protein